MKNRRWTAKEEHLILTARKSDAQIAKRTGRTLQAVRQRRGELTPSGTHRRPWSKEEDREILSYEGRLADLADAMDRSYEAVLVRRSRLKRLARRRVAA